MTGEEHASERRVKMSQFKQWKVSNLIAALQEAKKTYGDLPVWISSDEEGNIFGRAGETKGYCSVAVDDEKSASRVIIWPF